MNRMLFMGILYTKYKYIYIHTEYVSLKIDALSKWPRIQI